MNKNLLSISLQILLITTLISFSACNNSSDKVVEIIEERDSLRTAYEQQNERMKLVDEMIKSINTALDSISIEEGLLFTSENEEIPIKKNDVLRNLERYEQVLRHQQNRINELDSIFSRGGNAGMRKLVDHMKAQLAEKDAQIENLRTELSKKNVDINRLRQQVSSQQSQLEQQTTAIEELERKSQAQTKALTYQDNVINTCYVMIDTKKNLKNKGIVVKNKIQSNAALNKSNFAKVDIRKFREISFEAKRPRILTNMPSSSYQLTTSDKNHFTLRITDANAFWSVSNYLIIQTD